MVTSLAGKHVNLLLDLFVGDFDIIEVYVVINTKGNLEFGSKGNIKKKFETILGYDINLTLHGGNHRFTKNFKFVFLYIVHQRHIKQFVYLFHLGLNAITLFNKGERGLSLSETGYLHLRSDMLEFLLDGILIVCLLHFNGDDSTGACLLESNIHMFLIRCNECLYFNLFQTLGRGNLCS